MTLAYWNGFTGGDGPFMDELVEKFQQANPKITVKQNTIEWADFYQKVPAAVTANKGPDVGVMHQDQLATNAVRKVIVPVDDVAEALGLEESDFSPEVWKAGIYEDQRYGIPLDVHSLAMYWRTDDAEKAGLGEAPTDAASFDEALKKLQGGGMPQPFWMPTKWPSHLMFLSLLWQNGGEPYARGRVEGDLRLARPGIDALTWQVDQIKKGYSPKNVAQDTAVRRLQERQARGHLGRHLADQRPQGRQGRRSASPRSRPSAPSPRCGRTRTTSSSAARPPRTTTSSTRPGCSSTG